MSQSGDPPIQHCHFRPKPPLPLKPMHLCPLYPPPLNQMGLQGYVKRIICHFNCQICAAGDKDPHGEQGVGARNLACCGAGPTCIILTEEDDRATRMCEEQEQGERAGSQDQPSVSTLQLPESPPRLDPTAEPQSDPAGSDDVPPPIPPRLPLPQDGCRISSFTCLPQGKEENRSNEAGVVNMRRPAARSLRKTSTDWESQLQDEPLYQTYRTAVITDEIKYQTMCPTSGPSTGNSGEWWSRGKVSSLWQELPAVRHSGILALFSPRECKQQESMFEVLTSEASYLRSLRILIGHFMESRDLVETLIIRDKKTLFSNIVRVRDVSERFLRDLEDRVDQAPVISDICDIILHHAQHAFPAYVDYVRNQTYQEKMFNSLMQKNGQFAMVMSRLQESPCCQRLPFMSFLLLPFQRITRIKMLTENILKRTQEGSKQERTASEALACVSKIVKDCNTQVGKMKQMEELIHMAQSLDFNKLKAVPVISQNRYLEKRGELQELARGGAVFNFRSKFVSVYLFLFNDLLIITNKKGNSSSRYTVIDHAHRSLVQVQPDSVLKNSFYLILLENYQGQTAKRLLKAPTESDMHRWMAAFPNPSTPKEIEEVVYEDWDCPQVQCVEQYSAQQADELNLEPADIINVLRKTTEGWYEGIRLSDGEAGWFPVAYVLEITNEHVRRRNLREQYRITQATAQVLDSQMKTQNKHNQTEPRHGGEPVQP